MWRRVINKLPSKRLGALTGMTSTIGLGLYMTSVSQPRAICHGSHNNDNEQMRELEQRLALLEADARARHGFKSTSGQGNGVFSWDEVLTAKMPTEAREHERDMHGGFTEDTDSGVVYTGIPGAGLYAISPDLTTWTKVGADPRLKCNIHGIVCFKHNGITQIAVAQNDDQRVLIMDLDGNVQQELVKPQGGEFAFGEANAYYSERRQKTEAVFACTDVTYLQNKLYVVTGYCEGDFVLTAEQGQEGEWRWGRVAWGGKGEGPGKFSTAHGVFAHDDHIYVANREAFQVVKFSPNGELVEVLPDIPHGSRICNVAHANEQGYFVMNALAPLPHTAPKTAPIYAHDGQHVVSVIDAGSLGIPVLKHLHHVWPHYITDDSGHKHLHILVHGWRDGKFAVLKHEPDADIVTV